MGLKKTSTFFSKRYNGVPLSRGMPGMVGYLRVHPQALTCRARHLAMTSRGLRRGAVQEEGNGLRHATAGCCGRRWAPRDRGGMGHRGGAHAAAAAARGLGSSAPRGDLGEVDLRSWGFKSRASVLEILATDRQISQQMSFRFCFVLGPTTSRRVATRSIMRACILPRSVGSCLPGVPRLHYHDSSYCPKLFALILMAPTPAP